MKMKKEKRWRLRNSPGYHGGDNLPASFVVNFHAPHVRVRSIWGAPSCQTSKWHKTTGATFSLPCQHDKTTAPTVRQTWCIAAALSWL